MFRFVIRFGSRLFIIRYVIRFGIRCAEEFGLIFLLIQKIGFMMRLLKNMSKSLKKQVYVQVWA